MMSIKDIYDIFKASSEVCTDTRKISKDCLFFALKGTHFNGNLFAEQAIAQGALRAIVDDEKVVKNEKYILVDDVLSTLQKLATHHRRALNIPIVAITGTNGKTTTKELTKAVLDKKYKSFATKGNFNNHIGVPLTLLSLDQTTEIAVVEMGANHPGEIAFLCHIAEPNLGLITNVGKAHLEGFGSFEGVKKTKGELYRYIEDKKGVLFVNKSNTHLGQMLKSGAQLFFYGDTNDCKIRVTSLQNSSNLAFTCQINEVEVQVNAKLIGNYNLENALAAIAIGTYFGVQPHFITEAIAAYNPENNRSQMVISNKNKILFDAYNANPTSMKAALENFAALKDANKIAIIGEMKELGDDSMQEHKEVLQLLKTHHLKDVYLVGQNYKSLLDAQSKFKWVENVDSLIKKLSASPILNAFILVKGSRSNQLERLNGIL